MEGLQSRTGLEKHDDEKRTVCCQVKGCDVDLFREKVYCIKKRLCNKHMRADAVERQGYPGQWRFCFQCGKLQQLALFDGKQRSCRERLEMRRKFKRPSSSEQDQEQDGHRESKRCKTTDHMGQHPSSSCQQAQDCCYNASMYCQQQQMMVQAGMQQAYDPSGDSSEGSADSDVEAAGQLLAASGCQCHPAAAALPRGSTATPVVQQHGMQWCKPELDLFGARPVAAATQEGLYRGTSSVSGSKLVSGSSDAATTLHMHLVDQIVAELEGSADAAAEAEQLEQMIEQELLAAAAMPAGTPAQPSLAMKLNDVIDGLTRSISSSMSQMPETPVAAAPAPAAPVARFYPVVPAAAAPARMPAVMAEPCYSRPGCEAADESIAVRFRMLQQQLLQMHHAISDLRCHLQTSQ